MSKRKTLYLNCPEPFEGRLDVYESSTAGLIFFDAHDEEEGAVIYLTKKQGLKLAKHLKKICKQNES